MSYLLMKLCLIEVKRLCNPYLSFFMCFVVNLFFKKDLLHL
jgi:hypothetical protein